MTDPAFFGYGSLVNLATHNYETPRAAQLRGWRRHWQSTTLREAAFLSVIPDTNCTISGVVAHVPGADWIALDKREAAYLRHDVTDIVHHDGQPAPTAVYQIDPTLHSEHAEPILLSYLDVVVQGFLQMFGPDGVTDFFATTTGWRPVHNDRNVPLYPRAQQLTKDETALVDYHLSQLAD